MGDDVEFINIAVIQGGLIQLDLFNNTTLKGLTVYVDPHVFFTKLGDSLRVSNDAYMRDSGYPSNEEDEAED